MNAFFALVYGLAFVWIGFYAYAATPGGWWTLPMMLSILLPGVLGAFAIGSGAVAGEIRAWRALREERRRQRIRKVTEAINGDGKSNEW